MVRNGNHDDVDDDVDDDVHDAMGDVDSGGGAIASYRVHARGRGGAGQWTMFTCVYI